MRKFLLVTLMAMATIIYLYGVVSSFMVENVEEIDHVAETTTIVYVE